MNIIEAIEDPQLFGGLFKDPATWRPWRVFLSVLFGLPVTDEADLKLFKECTGLTELPKEPIHSVTCICGRRAGKSFVSALTCVFLACFKDWSAYLSPGERGMIFIIANDRPQATIIKRYVSGILDSSDLLRRMVEADKAESVDLKCRITISVKTNSFRTIRGYLCLCAVLEESAWWRSDLSANPDREVLAAIRPALSTIPESLLISISTPYAKRGILWDSYKKYFGQAGRTLVWVAPSLTMNRTLDAQLIKEALAEDPQAAAADWNCAWRTDIETFISSEALERCVVPGRYELPFVSGTKYWAALDPAGGSGRDSFTLAIGHRDMKTGAVVLDVLAERRPPFSPAAAVDEFSAILREFGLAQATSDSYAGSWPTEAFAVKGVRVVRAEKTASEFYVEALPMFTTGNVELLDIPRLIGQLANLERRTRAGGKDLVTHAPGSNDDAANSVCAMMVLAGAAPKRLGRAYFPGQGWSSPDQTPAVPSPAIPPRRRVFAVEEPAAQTSTLAEQLAFFLKRQRSGPDDDD